jgi:flagellin-like protein
MLKVFAVLTNSVRHDDRGISAVEYALLLIGIAVVLIGALSFFGQQLGGVFSTFATSIRGLG